MMDVIIWMNNICENMYAFICPPPPPQKKKKKKNKNIVHI